ncbi:hypothetical protein DIPPA_26431 [Diplonema papillatum]|nr:hypothetical protein DIPPA_26431 [Diplonema papillatum]
MRPAGGGRAAMLGILLLSAVCLVSGSASWVDDLKNSEVNNVGAPFGRLLEDVDQREQSNLTVVGMVNAHRSYVGRCRQCAELDGYLQAFVNPATKAFRKAGAGPLRFVRIEYAQTTQHLVQGLNLTVPCLFIVGPHDTAPRLFSRKQTQRRQQQQQQQERQQQASVAGPADSEAARLSEVGRRRRARRALALLPQAEIDKVTGAAGEKTNLETIARWFSIQTGVAVSSLPRVDVSANQNENQSSEGWSVQHVMVSAIALITFALYMWRCVTGPCKAGSSPDADAVQNIARVEGWVILLVGHAILTSGLYWCVLNEAPVMGADGSLVMSGRMKGQYYSEGIIIAVIIGSASYACLALHRVPEMEQYVDGGGRQVVRFALVVLVFTFLLLFSNFLHKHYWYLSDTWFRNSLRSLY